jgi:membrane-bound lytic murein transglycosylase D
LGGKGLKTWKNFFGPLGITLLLTSCGFSHGGLHSEGGLFNASGEGGLLNASGSRSPSSSGSYSSQTLDGDIMGVRLQNKNFDLPVVYNKEVAQWVNYFTSVGRRHFNIYLERKAKMAPVILPRLRAAGLPEDLIYLAMIESGFSTAAHSHAGAVGPWQFIRSTGRLFGLQSDWWKDERRDPIKSTEAAIEYLGRLHNEFGDWYLACAAYNSGEGKIRRAISRLGTRDFWEIASNRRALMRETKDYVPKMLAAAIIGKNAEQFGFELHQPDPSLTEFEEVKIPRAENLRTIAKVANISRERLAELNPELQRCCTPPQRGAYTLRIPKEAAQTVVAAIDAGELGRYAGFRRHVVRRGDNISTIAHKNGVPVEAILSMNEIHSVRALKLGTELVIPERAGYSSSSRTIASVSRPSHHRRSRPAYRAPAGQQAVTHVVQKGETLYGISRRYAVRVEQIRRWNDIHRAKNLRPGRRIKLYVRNENSDRI